MLFIPHFCEGCTEQWKCKLLSSWYPAVIYMLFAFQTAVSFPLTCEMTEFTKISLLPNFIEFYAIHAKGPDRQK